MRGAGVAINASAGVIMNSGWRAPEERCQGLVGHPAVHLLLPDNELLEVVEIDTKMSP
jgi:hypothetical protein